MNYPKKRIIIVGGTSGIAERCARLWVANEPVELYLFVRDLGKAENVVADLRVRSPKSNIQCLEVDFLDSIKIKSIAEKVTSEGPLDIVLIAHGTLPVQLACQNDISVCNEALSINGISPVLFAEALIGHMEKAGKGTLAVISSVAGDRGRKSNYVYGAAKGLVSRYVQGLQHRLMNTNIKVVLIKPGPTDTPMTAHLKNNGHRLASADKVAADIVSAIENGKPVLYTPAKWLIIMMIVQHLPRFIFNRTNF